ncbi:DUF6025 family protein [Paenibacillus dendritiformis]|uniref:DUF6025 family protein n=1 Tax=Paenibacillus dendritiformis TaxID=130049 RepID=UPI00365367FF
MSKPIEFMRELNLQTKLEHTNKNNKSNLQRFIERECAFDWVHLGMTDVKVGLFLSLIERTPYLCPPRSGHIGNWEKIARGHAGMLDFNQTICSCGYGYPSLYSFNQTESSELISGDVIYLPGSIFEQEQRIELPLYTWNGERFVERDRRDPLFTPFVQTMWNGELIPLIQLHQDRLSKFPEFRFRPETSFVQVNHTLISRILYVLIDHASNHENPRSWFQDILSHQVTLDGKMHREDILYEHGIYRMGGTVYQTIDELVQAAMLPFQSVNDPKLFFGQIKSMPQSFPLVSNVLMRLLSAFFNTHYPDTAVDRLQMTQPFNPHFHWGARDMAGYPPKKGGYFATKSKLRNYKRFCKIIVDEFPELDPILFIVIPAVIFSLCPNDANNRDSKCLTNLFKRVQAETLYLHGSPEMMNIEIERITKEWLQISKPFLSEYWLSRFRKKSGVLTKETYCYTHHAAVEPEGFREMTFRQLCMIVGALMECD